MASNYCNWCSRYIKESSGEPNESSTRGEEATNREGGWVGSVEKENKAEKDRGQIENESKQ